jgi:hypothetical protein
VSTNATTAVRSAGATVSASISVSSDDRKDQVNWAGFDKLEIGPATFKHVLLIGYQNGFQVIEIQEASNFNELVSKRDGPVTFLQMLPIPAKSDENEGFRSSHPLLLLVSSDEANKPTHCQTFNSVRFYSLRSNSYVQVLRFRSPVFMVRCSPRIVAVGLETQIYCIDAITLQNKFSVLTYPVPRFGAQGTTGVNVGYGPLAVGPRWLAYGSDNPLSSNTSRLSPKNLSPSTSPNNSSLMVRYAMESSKHLATGIINLGDIGYKTLSKYCNEMLPDGSNSPVLTNSGWKVRLGGPESDNAGTVVVMDVVSGRVISQFRAHTSPISALCFDPSGTLLVTASIHGNNINIFRIMPNFSRSKGSNGQDYDWTSSHVHLYKLHRGLTSAIIQDISFSHYSQWISIVSSKGTCHIYFISPFGGECYPTHAVPSLPWWSTPYFIVNRRSFSPPPPVTLSVVSRIKDNNSGIISSVSSVASSAVGKAYVPSGAVAAIFHNSMPGVPEVSRSSPLENLLVYNPSGHVVQHEVLQSVGHEVTDFGSKPQSRSYVQMQDEELKVKVEPIQWWDVRRKSDSPERDESIVDSFNKNGSVAEKSVKADPSHLFLSNAEVQISSGRFPIWRNSKIHLHVMSSSIVEGSANDGEFEIEKIPSHEMEIKHKDLLPVFDHFHSGKSGWNDRRNPGERSPIVSSVDSKISDETFFCHSNPASLSSTESSDGGSSRRTETLVDLSPTNNIKSSIPVNGFLSYPIIDDPNHTIKPNSDISDVPLLNNEPRDVKKADDLCDGEEDEMLLGGMFDFSEEG